MNSPTDEIVLEPDQSPAPGSSSAAAQEAAFFAKAPAERAPNSVVIHLWRDGHLSWHSESSAPVLALIMLLVLVATVVVTVLLSSFLSDRQWLSGFLQVMGNAISGVVGAVVGSSAAAGRIKKK